MSSFAFDAVIFDLDGTLVATERYWPDAARAAALAFSRDFGLQREVPGTAEWLQMVGRPMDEAFAEAFPALDAERLGILMAACAKAEKEQLARREGAALPFAEQLLDGLRQRGVRVGVASNCGFDYLNTMMDGVGLGRWVEEARCLRSPGVRTKADMVADILQHFDTRSAVMVGDRRGDRDAAWENGLPFVHIPRGYGGLHEQVAAEATLDGLDQLLPRLGARDASVSGILERFADASKLGVLGLPLAGKTLLARDLQRAARAAGRSLEVLDDPSEADLSLCDALVAITASEEVLVRRARGLRLGVGPVERLMERLPSARARLLGMKHALRIDGDNPLDLAIERG
ncbi:bifunctional 5'-methylthioadenosine/S-adenosylhomocysteine nucleosidase/phosphatase [Planctomycetes bacterium Poly30]|uniref:phosphoglycolate phosphatase n=1 Tax=Saltatorellus ferox TaxID=2528018 RepID=A0A518EWK2_9BACT|nr:bifunctional 5'-methylthioadenosine/S-adenosylhomocysteine nucleosidase/phosphatase [Planctomycetes bacterium Poly30]